MLQQQFNMKPDKEIEPPWIYAPGYEPARAFWRQEGQMWLTTEWIPYWETLNSEERETYLKKWNVPDVWANFSYHINPEFKAFLDSVDDPVEQDISSFDNRTSEGMNFVSLREASLKSSLLKRSMVLGILLLGILGVLYFIFVF